MGGSFEERFQWKEPFHSLEVELQHDYGLTPVGARALIRRIGVFLDSYVEGSPNSRGDGQIRYPAVTIGERAGKPIKHCLTVPVALTVLHASDVRVLDKEGSPALRRVRLSRLCSEALRQGAALGHEDLSLLLGVELSTVRRMVAEVAATEGERPPTRGLVADIGPTVSHKEQAVRLFFRGLPPGAIAARTGHSLGSIERYLGDFARVVELARRGGNREVTARITGLSPALVGRYRELMEAFDLPANRIVFDRLSARFGPVELPGSDEVSDG